MYCITKQGPNTKPPRAMGATMYQQQQNQHFSRTPDKNAYWNFFSYFSTKTYVVGTQKNHLNETVLLSTQNICLN